MKDKLMAWKLQRAYHTLRSLERDMLKAGFMDSHGAEADEQDEYRRIAEDVKEAGDQLMMSGPGLGIDFGRKPTVAIVAYYVDGDAGYMTFPIFPCWVDDYGIVHDRGELVDLAEHFGWDGWEIYDEEVVDYDGRPIGKTAEAMASLVSWLEEEPTISILTFDQNELSLEVLGDWFTVSLEPGDPVHYNFNSRKDNPEPAKERLLSSLLILWWNAYRNHKSPNRQAVVQVEFGETVQQREVMDVADSLGLATFLGGLAVLVGRSWKWSDTSRLLATSYWGAPISDGGLYDGQYMEVYLFEATQS